MKANSATFEDEIMPSGDNGNGNLMRATFAKLFIWALIGVCSGCVGFGLSQMTVIRDVNRNAYAISSLSSEIATRKEALTQERVERQAADDLANRRVDKITESLNHLIDQNTQLISLIKAQNQILQSK